MLRSEHGTTTVLLQLRTTLAPRLRCNLNSPFPPGASAIRLTRLFATLTTRNTRSMLFADCPSHDPMKVLVSLLFLAGVIANAQAPAIPVGYDAYRQWGKWPYQRIGMRAYMRSTYDRSGG